MKTLLALCAGLLLCVPAFAVNPHPPRRGRGGGTGNAENTARVFKTWDEARKATTAAEDNFKSKLDSYNKVHRELQDARGQMTNDVVDRANKVRELESKVGEADRAKTSAKKAWQESAMGARDWANANGDQKQKSAAADWVTNSYRQ
jgi:Skp family chaperone for outer membrane proteins